MAEAAGEAEAEEREFLMEKVAILDFDMLCASVTMQSQKGKWGPLNRDAADEEERGVGYGNGGFRMWEGELVHDCFEDQRIALQSVCCPCYRFGKNMRRASFGSCFLQDSDSTLDDCLYHLACPCCSLCQESRTLEMNNVQDGIWHGRGDTICIGSSGGAKAYFERNVPPIMSRHSPEPEVNPKAKKEAHHSADSKLQETSPLV